MSTAEQLVQALSMRHLKLVLAESCTGGLAAATLAQVPGVSNWLCGSAVTYRSETKIAWLGIKPQLIRDHTAVSREVAAQMAAGVLATTPEADLAAAITGHLGPDAPEGFDGVVFVAIAQRGCDDPSVSRHQLQTITRGDRQAEAANLLLAALLQRIG